MTPTDAPSQGPSGFATTQAATVGLHPCPECGANLEWNAAKQALVCPYCGTTASWRASEAGAGSGAGEVLEQDLEAALRDPRNQRGLSDQQREVQCQNCHAISVFSDGRVAQRCDFCGSPAIVAHEAFADAITPQSILPFKWSDAQVRDRLRQWYGSRWFAPNKLKKAALTDRLKGIYLPYWTFDAQAQAHWRADAGHYYYTTQSYRDANGQQQTRRVQQVRWVPASGALSHFFDDELVPGTVGVSLARVRNIEPFPTVAQLVPYSPEYVRGWTVERYQVDLRQAATIGKQQMQDQLRALCAARVPGDTYRNLVIDAQYHGRTFKHILVPIWLVHYTYGRKTFEIVVNGYTGKISGEQPYSWIKILCTAMAVIALIAVLAMYWGR